MYKSLTKKDWHKLVKFPTDRKVDALVVSENSIQNRERELNLFENALSQFPNTKKVEYIKDRFFGSICEYQIGNKLIWFDVAYGGAYLSELVHIACIFGSQKNFLIGSCGGLQKKLNTGDLIIPTYTYGNESTTRMYQNEIKDNRHYSNKNLSNELIKSISDYNIYSGSIITCQAMLAETKEDVDKWSKEGYLGVEMESSTFFAVSNHFNVPSTAILHVSDNLVKDILYGDKELDEKKDFRNKLKISTLKLILDNILLQELITN